MLPRTLLTLSTRTDGNRVVPHYLMEGDQPWLRAVLDEYARFVGRRWSELAERFLEPLEVRAPRIKLRVVRHLLEKLGSTRLHASVSPCEARWAAFRRAAGSRAPRAQILSEVARELGVREVDVEAALFADLRSERRVGSLPPDLDPAKLAERGNLELVSSLLRKAVRVRITAWGNTHALVRHARRLGLICVVRATNEPGVGEPVPDTLELELSGPFTLFRHTELYGRELASLVPRAAWCQRFELVAQCALGRGRATSELVVRSGDPIAAAAEPPLDSRLEERFRREFARAARGWEIVREPAPIQLIDSLLFPDFELVHRSDPSRRWLLEIVGFWTRDSVESKLRRLREANFERLVLCIDERRKCSNSDLPFDAKIIRYRTRIDPAAVLAVIGT